MNLDRTFCSGLRCNRTISCDRFSGRLEEYMGDHPELRWETVVVSMAQFADHEGKCYMYQPIEKKDDNGKV